MEQPQVGDATSSHLMFLTVLGWSVSQLTLQTWATVATVIAAISTAAYNIYRIRKGK
jgi:hypothetical protein